MTPGRKEGRKKERKDERTYYGKIKKKGMCLCKPDMEN
jgi:hypothetical protein